jgi:hypothetical protein
MNGENDAFSTGKREGERDAEDGECVFVLRVTQMLEFDMII